MVISVSVLGLVAIGLTAISIALINTIDKGGK